VCPVDDVDALSLPYTEVICARFYQIEQI